MMETPYSNSSLVSTPLIFFMNYKKKTFPARQIELAKKIRVNCTAHDFDTKGYLSILRGCSYKYEFFFSHIYYKTDRSYHGWII